MKLGRRQFLGSAALGAAAAQSALSPSSDPLGVRADFPAAAKGGDDAKGRFLTPLADGTVVVTWGIGRQNKGFLMAASFDDGKTWQAKPLHRLPDMPVTARYGAPRTVELKDGGLGTVFYNEKGLYFLRTLLAVR